jgi:hypothetical protein
MKKPETIPCRTCGKPIPQEPGWRHPKLVCRSGTFQPNGAERPSKCAQARYDRRKRNASKRLYKERHPDKIRAYYLTPEFREHRNWRDRRQRQINPEVWRERSRRQMVRRREREGRARLVLEYRLNGRDLLAKVREAVPRHYERATRDEMIGEAVMLALEGATIADAVKAAIKATNKAEAPGRYAKPIEDCFWL